MEGRRAEEQEGSLKQTVWQTNAHETLVRMVSRAEGLRDANCSLRTSCPPVDRSRSTQAQCRNKLRQRSCLQRCKWIQIMKHLN
jgi:hypothetical protein